uniref:Sphingomyelinase phosphodiesterase n=1 Tax=Phallusia mammillata TaxID=59560 RepID=A0A6F9DTQ6_9ASCI|nr:acid sphingomyelinase-like phosphodiesterase 3b [Phallusia mammillata]
MHFSLIVCFLLPSNCSASISLKQFTAAFWHITDLHLDFYYTQQKGCPWSTGAPAVYPGPFGDFKCDSPWKLINSTFQEMKRIKPNPDFILWTGDNILHVHENEKYLSTKLVLQTEMNLTRLIDEMFPETPIYTVLGNHDYFPFDHMPIEENNVRAKIANIWNKWIPEDQIDLFKKGGYYSVIFEHFGPNLQLLMLNTNLWDLLNPHVKRNSDPAGQFKWLESQLQKSQQMHYKVFIVGHHPPGVFELSDNDYWFYPKHNRRYIELVQKYHDIIEGQFFGHNHRDSFRVFWDKHRKPISTLWIAPSVTPHSKEIQTANNPGIRLFEYCPLFTSLKDYVQYYFNLTDGNVNGNATWIKEYRATEEFQVPNINPASMASFLHKLMFADVRCDVTGPECEDNRALQRFSLINSVSYDFRYCDSTCQRRHLCAMSEVEYNAHRKCIESELQC